MWTYTEPDSYTVGGELYHYGVKGMKWKDHKYIRMDSGEYIYNYMNKNLSSVYRPTVTKTSNPKTTTAKKATAKVAKASGAAFRKKMWGMLNETTSSSKAKGSGGSGGGGKGKGSGGKGKSKKGSKKKKKSGKKSSTPIKETPTTPNYKMTENGLVEVKMKPEETPKTSKKKKKSKKNSKGKRSKGASYISKMLSK